MENQTPNLGIEMPDPKTILLSRVREFTQSIKLTRDAGYDLSSRILMFAAIDMFGSFLRPVNEADTNGGHFKRWVSDYMIPGSGLPLTADDLWAARCGLLHTHTASSKLSREGDAVEIHYYKGIPNEAWEHAFRSIATQRKQFINLDRLNEAFERGIGNFLDDIQRNPELEKRVLHHCSRVLGHWKKET
jgi:hypothetical protein